MIIAHLLLDTPTLKAFSATCHSWYIATLPHLHHTLTLRDQNSDPAYEGFKRLRKLAKLGLLPLVKRLWIQQRFNSWFLPKSSNAWSLTYFAALTNLQELGVDGLDLYAFTPQAQLAYFGHLAPTLRSLILGTPRGARPKLLYFLGLFPNLDDLKLVNDSYLAQEAPPDAAPIPQSTPSLRGRLVLTRWFGGQEFLKDLSALSGGLRFRYMDLTDVESGCARLLLDGCAESLKILRICPVNSTGKRTSGGSSPV